MKILFYGAGVIGQIYAAKLFEVGIDTTLVARGHNFQKLRNNGVTLYDVETKKKINQYPSLTHELKD